MLELISQLPFLGGFLSVALPFILVLGIVVFVHEYGHYIVGRWCGIGAETFSMGFGPVLKSWKDKRGTRWQVSAFPLGGYVKFIGDADPSSQPDPGAMAELSTEDQGRSFHGAPLYKRSLTVAAGPVANFILSVIVFAGLAMYVGVASEAPVVGQLTELPQTERGLQEGDLILEVNGAKVSDYQGVFENARNGAGNLSTLYTVQRGDQVLEVQDPYLFPPLVGALAPLNPAIEAGMEVGDYILSANGTNISAFGDLKDIVLASKGEQLVLEVWRQGQVETLTMTPRISEFENEQLEIEKRVMIGAVSQASFEPATYTPNPLEALKIGVVRTYTMISGTLRTLYHLLVGNLSATNLNGPLGIAMVSGDVAKQGLLYFISLIGSVSTAIGFMNLLPIPVLDGGHLVMFGFEAITGRPPRELAIRIAVTAGLSLVLLLMFFATYNDLIRLLGRI